MEEGWCWEGRRAEERGVEIVERERVREARAVVERRVREVRLRKVEGVMVDGEEVILTYAVGGR